MNILIDIGHPAHVHLFKHLAWQMQEKGHKVLFTCREKEFEIELLNHYNLDFISFGSKYSSTPGKIWGMFEFDWKMFWVAKKLSADIFLSHGSIYAAQVSWLLKKPHICLEDTGNQEQVRLYKPFTDVILTSDIFPFNYEKKQIRFRGHNEIAYLRDNYFTPDSTILGNLGLKEKKYALLRFVAWQASHDISQSGIDMTTKRSIIKTLQENRLKVLISAEGNIDPEFAKYLITIPPHQIHDLLYYAKVYIGEGTTMAMESGVLGTPAIYINSLQYSNCKDLAKYGLVYNFSRPTSISSTLKNILSNYHTQAYPTKREKLIEDKIDVTAFLVWFVENYPESVKIMKKNPGFQQRFK